MWVGPLRFIPQTFVRNLGKKKSSFGTDEKMGYNLYQLYSRASLVAQMVKIHLPVMQETQVRSLGWEDPLEKGMATHSSILAWRTPRTEEPGGLQSMG